jgi:hypothetical protein
MLQLMFAYRMSAIDTLNLRLCTLFDQKNCLHNKLVCMMISSIIGVSSSDFNFVCFFNNFLLILYLLKHYNCFLRKV